MSAIDGTRGLLDTPAEGRFDRIARLARERFQASISVLVLVDGDRAWFKAAEGVDVTEVPRREFPGIEAVDTGLPIVARDTLLDPRFVGHPWVSGGPRIRFAALQPIRTADGAVAGTLGVFGPRPREAGAADLLDLEGLAALAERELRERPWSATQRDLVDRLEPAARRSLVDPPTRLWNHTAIEFLFWREVAVARRCRGSAGVMLARIETPSHASLATAAACARMAVRPEDELGRWNGDTLLGVLPGLAVAGSTRVAERVRACIAEFVPGASVAIGVAAADGREKDRMGALWDAALALQRARNAGRGVSAVPPVIGTAARELEAARFARVC